MQARQGPTCAVAGLPNHHHLSLGRDAVQQRMLQRLPGARQQRIVLDHLMGSNDIRVRWLAVRQDFFFCVEASALPVGARLRCLRGQGPLICYLCRFELPYRLSALAECCRRPSPSCAGAPSGVWPWGLHLKGSSRQRRLRGGSGKLEGSGGANRLQMRSTPVLIPPKCTQTLPDREEKCKKGACARRRNEDRAVLRLGSLDVPTVLYIAKMASNSIPRRPGPRAGWRPTRGRNSKSRFESARSALKQVPYIDQMAMAGECRLRALYWPMPPPVPRAALPRAWLSTCRMPAWTCSRLSCKVMCSPHAAEASWCSWLIHRRSGRRRCFAGAPQAGPCRALLLDMRVPEARSSTMRRLEVEGVCQCHVLHATSLFLGPASAGVHTLEGQQLAVPCSRQSICGSSGQIFSRAGNGGT